MDTPFHSNNYLLSLFVQMYGQCRGLEDAHSVFAQIQEKNVYTWNIILGINAKLGMWWKMREIYHRMLVECCLPDKYTIVSNLSAHVDSERLTECKAMHAGFANTHLEEDMVVGTALMNLYGHTGDTNLATILFVKLHNHDLITCNSLIAVYAQQGKENEAFQLFEHILQQGFLPNRVTFLAVVDACNTSAALFIGKKFHAYVSCTELDLDPFVLTIFISMYGKCDDLGMAVSLFDKLSDRHVVSWNSIISVKAHKGHKDDVFRLFFQMQQEGSLPDKVTFRTILCSFSGYSDLGRGKLIHIYVMSQKFDSDMIIGTALFGMYGRCSDLESARRMFDGMINKDVVAWNAMIALYGGDEHGGNSVLELIDQMQAAGVSADKVTLTSGLSACAGVSIEAAQRLFEKVKERNVAVWNAMLGACENQGYGKLACDLFVQMLEETAPDKVTCLVMLSLYAGMGSTALGMCVHILALYFHYDSDGPLISGLISMYSKCCCLDEAGWIFGRALVKDAVIFNSFITACVDHDRSEELFQVRAQMLQEAMIPDEITFISTLDMCAVQGTLAEAKSVHACIVKSSYLSDVSIATSLFSMYYKCNNLEEALSVFSSIIHHDIISWTAIISATAEQKQSKVVLQLFHQMRNEGMHADNGVYVNVLTACADEAALAEGKSLHSQITHDNLPDDVALGNALINMYTKCGCIKNAKIEFKKMIERDIVSFNIMIAGLAQHGHGIEALLLSAQMQQDGVIPNDYTLSSILCACSHGGLTEEGCACLGIFFDFYSCIPSIENFDCIVDLFGRSGQLEQAKHLLDSVPLQPTCVSYMTLLGAARIQMDICKGADVSQYLIELDSEDAAYYVAVANLYSLVGKIV
ncbi:hypothetical protein KP509_10G025400 [Ceratopteris richardii]|nr:hypothetical protein KP509_10G025400 [Ceratopteris richardii]